MDADAIFRLAVGGLLTDSEVHRARQRLTNRMVKVMKAKKGVGE
jgi:hypothetical protein